MEFEKWEPWYEKIRAEFGFSRFLDQAAANVLSLLVRGKTLTPETLRLRFSGKPALVFGAGPSLEEDLRQAISSGLAARATLIPADGATGALLDCGLTPHLVVSDLDGRFEDIHYAQRLGSVICVHAHGDNIPLLWRLVPRLEAPLLATTQVEPREGVFCVGGFTDGDRAAFLAHALGATRIVLAGMDLGAEVGGRSKRVPPSAGAREVKLRKLKFARELLGWLSALRSEPLLNITGRGEAIAGTVKVTARQALSALSEAGPRSQ